MKVGHGEKPTKVKTECVRWGEMLEVEGVYRINDSPGFLSDERFIVLNDDAKNAVYVSEDSAVEAYPPAWDSHTFIKTDEKVYLSIR
jgi:hypothetical protein